MTQRFFIFLNLVFLGFSSLIANDSDLEFSKPSYTVFHEFGRLEKAISENVIPIEQQWVHRSGAWMNFFAQKDDRLKLDAIIGGVYWIPTLEDADRPSKTRFFLGTVPRLDVSYSFGDLEEPSLVINGGVFHHKYNDNIKNLGSYMFRSGTYPGWISTGWLHYIKANASQLTGIRIQHNTGQFKQELIFSLETSIIPNFDAHITYMAQWNPSEMLQVGGGLQLARILPARPSKTNPDQPENRYFKYHDNWYVDRAEYYESQLEFAKAGIQSVQDIADTATDPTLSNQLNQEITAHYLANDTLEFTNALALLDTLGFGRNRTPIDSKKLDSINIKHFKASGIKPVFYFAIDPKPLFESDIFGPKDLVLYGELALLGVQDYPVLYDNMMERMPMMIGFNIPTFKLLDVLAIELEYYGSQLPNSIRNVQNSGMPQPTFPNEYSPEDWKKDDIKWSIYAERTIINGVQALVQVANDHGRGWQYPTGKTDWSMYPDKKHWYWMGQIRVTF